jgi:hypothetical protein
MIFIAALGMMAGLTAADVTTLKSWQEAVTPEFVGLQMLHFSVVVGAFIAGKLIPTERNPDMRTRDSDRNAPPNAPTVVVVPVEEKKP